MTYRNAGGDLRGLQRAALLLDPLAWKWDAECIRLSVWLSLAGTTVWLVLRLFEPRARLFAP
jgi:hypothetical protein